MKQQEVFNKIGGIIKELNDQYKYLEANPDDINSLELELFVANAHFLADHADILNKINLLSPRPVAPAPPPITPVREEKFFEPVVRQQEKKLPATTDVHTENTSINFEIAAPEESFAPVNAEPEIIRHELQIDDDLAWDDEEPYEEDALVENADIIEEEEETESVTEVQEPEPAPEEIPQQQPPPPALAAIADQEKMTINQRMAAQLNKGGVVDKPAGQPVADLKQAISLNEKLLFIKDLFNGYSLAYSEAIEILNRFESFEDAERFLSKNYISKNNWESKPDTTARFYDLLKRRYA